MRCEGCGHDNPLGSVFCQQCGSKIEQGSVEQSSAEQAACQRCGGQNDPTMRFCVTCGFNMHGGTSMPPDATVASDTPEFDDNESREDVAERMSKALGGPLCKRCRGVGDPGAEFCKFCGTRYAEAEPTRTKLAGKLVSIRKDGSDGASYDLVAPQTDVGREEGDVVLADDPYLSPRHARIRFDGGRVFLRDLSSMNGVYVRIREPVTLRAGDMILIGQQVLRFELLDEAERSLGSASQHGVLAFGTPQSPRYARLVQYTTEGVGRDVYYLHREETVLGRETGDVVFTDDPFLSRRHATIKKLGDRIVLADLDSSNGTSHRIHGEQELADGDQFRIGRHLFRFENFGASH